MMSLNIKHPEADRLARQLVQLTGDTITHIIIMAMREQLLREQRKRSAAHLAEQLLEISQRCKALPDCDPRTPDEILGYDKDGLPH